jgi:3-oxoadipate enol-lactonase
MARIGVEPGFEVNCEVDDYLWPWDHPTPVLMHHGFSRNAGFWRRWIPTLTESRRVYRPEMRGCGKSDVPPRDFPLDTEILASDLVRVMDTLGLERVHWVGESSGGVVGVLFAATFPERVASLVLVNTPLRATNGSAAAFGDALQAKGSAQSKLLEEMEKMVATYAGGEGSTAAAITKYGVGEWCRQTLQYRIDLDLASPELQDFYITEMGKTPGYVGAMIQNAINVVDALPLLKTLSMPVLLLCGDKKKTTLEQQQIMAREIPHVRLNTFEGFGNAIGVLAPERCARDAIEFWKSIDPPAKTG